MVQPHTTTHQTQKSSQKVFSTPKQKSGSLAQDSWRNHRKEVRKLVSNIKIRLKESDSEDNKAILEEERNKLNVRLIRINSIINFLKSTDNLKKRYKEAQGAYSGKKKAKKNLNKAQKNYYSSGRKYAIRCYAYKEEYLGLNNGITGTDNSSTEKLKEELKKKGLEGLVGNFAYKNSKSHMVSKDSRAKQAVRINKFPINKSATQNPRDKREKPDKTDRVTKRRKLFSFGKLLSYVFKGKGNKPKINQTVLRDELPPVKFPHKLPPPPRSSTSKSGGMNRGVPNRNSIKEGVQPRIPVPSSPPPPEADSQPSKAVPNKEDSKKREQFSIVPQSPAVEFNTSIGLSSFLRSQEEPTSLKDRYELMEKQANSNPSRLPSLSSSPGKDNIKIVKDSPSLQSQEYLTSLKNNLIEQRAKINHMLNLDQDVDLTIIMYGKDMLEEIGNMIHVIEIISTNIKEEEYLKNKVVNNKRNLKLQSRIDALREQINKGSGSLMKLFNFYKNNFNGENPGEIIGNIEDLEKSEREEWEQYFVIINQRITVGKYSKHPFNMQKLDRMKNIIEKAIKEFDKAVNLTKKLDLTRKQFDTFNNTDKEKEGRNISLRNIYSRFNNNSDKEQKIKDQRDQFLLDKIGKFAYEISVVKESLEDLRCNFNSLKLSYNKELDKKETENTKKVVERVVKGYDQELIFKTTKIIKDAIKFRPQILKLRTSFKRCNAITISNEDTESGTFSFSIEASGNSDNQETLKQVTNLMEQTRKAVRKHKDKNPEPYKNYINALVEAYPKHNFSEKIGLIRRVGIKIISWMKHPFNKTAREDFRDRKQTDPLDSMIARCKKAVIDKEDSKSSAIDHFQSYTNIAKMQGSLPPPPSRTTISNARTLDSVGKEKPKASTIERF